MRKKPFDQELYKKSSINDLILFCLNSVAKNREKCTFERLIKECFYLFPQTFWFSQFPKWPDSRKLDRPLRTLRKRKLIKGSPKTLFSLTKQGNERAGEVAKSFGQIKLKL